MHISTAIRIIKIPNYEYACDNCGATLEIYQKFEDKPLKRCKECKKHKLYRVISILYASVKGEPSTIYHQAARNTENMGKYQLEELRSKTYKKEENTPFWRKGRKPNMQLNKMNDSQKKQYVQKGIYPNDKFKPKQSKADV